MIVYFLVMNSKRCTCAAPKSYEPPIKPPLLEMLWLRLCVVTYSIKTEKELKTMMGKALNSIIVSLILAKS